MPEPDRQPGLPILALPLIASFTLRFAFGMVDLVFARELGDPAAVAAIGLYLPFQAGYVAIWVGLSSGLTATLSRAFGHADEARVAALRRATLRTLAVVIPLASLAGLAIDQALPHLGRIAPSLALEPDLLAAFRIYGTTMLIGMPWTGFWSILPDSIVKAHHDMRSTMVAGLLATGTNLALNYAFVFGFGLGLFGIALATIVSRLTALAYAVWRARRLEADRRASGRFRPRSDVAWRPPIRDILVLGLPATLAFVLTAVEQGLVNGMLLQVAEPTAAIASYGVFHYLLQLALMPAVAVGAAVLPYVARRVPEGRHAAVASDLRRTALLAAAVGLAFTIPAGLLFPDSVGAYFVPQRAGDGAVGTPMTRDLLRLLPFAAVAALPFLMLRPVFEALARPRTGVFVTVLRFGLLAYPLLVVGRLLAPVVGVAPVVGIGAGLIAANAAASSVTAVLASRRLAEAAAGLQR